MIRLALMTLLILLGGCAPEESDAILRHRQVREGAAAANRQAADRLKQSQDHMREQLRNAGLDNP
ncbi:MAG TPA: hypothetical protein QF800_03585 [Phycisphaerales bacterium]|jgi:Flp pilus assembly protein TadG|nr:hypothetical protein [Phycisphaerales bacterium]